MDTCNPYPDIGTFWDREHVWFWSFQGFGKTILCKVLARLSNPATCRSTKALITVGLSQKLNLHYKAIWSLMTLYVHIGPPWLTHEALQNLRRVLFVLISRGETTLISTISNPIYSLQTFISLISWKCSQGISSWTLCARNCQVTAQTSSTLRE